METSFAATLVKNINNHLYNDPAYFDLRVKLEEEGLIPKEEEWGAAGKGLSLDTVNEDPQIISEILKLAFRNGYSTTQIMLPMIE